MSEDLDAIAKGLTRAQRRTVLAGRLDYGRGYWPLKHALGGKGLMTTANGYFTLTRLGMQLQTHLKEAASGQ